MLRHGCLHTLQGISLESCLLVDVEAVRPSLAVASHIHYVVFAEGVGGRVLAEHLSQASGCHYARHIPQGVVERRLHGGVGIGHGGVLAYERYELAHVGLVYKSCGIGIVGGSLCAQQFGKVESVCLGEASHTVGKVVGDDVHLCHALIGIGGVGMKGSPLLLGVLLHGVVPVEHLTCVEHALYVVWSAREVEGAQRAVLLQFGYHLLSES